VNPYRAWLLGIAISLLFIGFLVWLMGVYSRFAQGPLGPLGEDVVGLGEIAWGSGLAVLGLLFFALWLVVSALLHGLQPAASRAAGGGEAERTPAEKPRHVLNLGGDVELR
jgi:hypothetical protein